MKLKHVAAVAAFSALAQGAQAVDVPAGALLATERQALETVSMMFMSELCRELANTVEKANVGVTEQPDPDAPASKLTKVYKYGTAQKPMTCGRALYIVPVDAQPASSRQLEATAQMIGQVRELARSYAMDVTRQPADMFQKPLVDAYKGLISVAGDWRTSLNAGVVTKALTPDGKPSLIDMYYSPPRPGGGLEQTLEAVRTHLWEMDQARDPDHYISKPKPDLIEVRYSPKLLRHALT